MLILGHTVVPFRFWTIIVCVFSYSPRTFIILLIVIFKCYFVVQICVIVVSLLYILYFGLCVCNFGLEA